MAPFTRQAVEANAVGLDGFILASCLTSLRVPNRDLRRQQLIAEMLAPHYPEERILGQEESRAELSRVLDNTAKLSDQTWFIDTLMEMNRTDGEGQGTFAGAGTQPNAGGWMIPNEPPTCYPSQARETRKGK